ncbi:unnamed protein product [Prunus brigantina]
MRPSTGRTFTLDKWKKLCMLAFGGIYHHPPLRIRWMMASKPIICKLIKMHPLRLISCSDRISMMFMISFLNDVWVVCVAACKAKPACYL